MSILKSFQNSMIALLIVLMMAFIGPIGAAGQQPDATPPADEAHEVPVLEFGPTSPDNKGYFDLQLDPGETTTVSVWLGNGGSVPARVKTYAADSFTLRNGGFGLRNSTDQDTGTTTWLDYPDEELTLEPGTGVERSLTVTVPPDATPGQYASGIALELAEPLDSGESDGMFQFKQILRSARQVFITVPGPEAPAIQLGDVSVEQDGAVPTVVIDVSNTGNVLLLPAGTIEISDTGGAPILSAEMQMGPVYAGDETTIELGLSSELPKGTYTVNVVIRDESTGVEASLVDESLTVLAAATPAPPPPISIIATSAKPGPDASNVQFASIEATISNIGDPVTNAQLSLLAFKDGEEVERFPVSQSLSLPQGDTPITTRYIPLMGWSSGEWSFELLLETVEGNGAAVVVASRPVEGSIIVP